MSSTSTPLSTLNPNSYISNPNGYAAFDTSGLSNSAISNANAQGENQIAQAKAQAAGAGGGRSTGAQNAVNGIQSGLGQNAQNVLSNNAYKTFESQLGQMNAQNQFNLGASGLENQAYGAQSAGNAQNAQATSTDLGSIMTLLTLLGSSA